MLNFLTSFRPTIMLICLSVFSVLVALFSCSENNPAVEGDPVARAFGYYLYAGELEGVVPKNASHSDSVALVKDFIDNWIRKKVVLKKAESNLGDEQKDVSRQLEEYRSSLITYAYESKLIGQNLDTSVSDAQIASYYERNKQNFELKDNIIKVVYLRLARNAPKLAYVKEWYKREDAKSRQLLADYCRQYAENYYLDDQTWLLFDDLLKEIPIKTYDKEQFLMNNRVLEITDNNSLYLVNIKGFMIKNSTSPLSFERDNIRQMIVNERKLRLIEEMEKKAYEEARKKGDIEVF